MTVRQHEYLQITVALVASPVIRGICAAALLRGATVDRTLKFHCTFAQKHGSGSAFAAAQPPRLATTEMSLETSDVDSALDVYNGKR
jgi:hypothetical protein